MSGSTLAVQSTITPLVSETEKIPEAVIPKLDQWHYFPSVLYTIEKPEYLPLLRAIGAEYIDAISKNTQLNEIYPVWQTVGFQHDARIAEFIKFIGTTCWDILAGQGYNMVPFHTTITELWCQEHHKFSGQDEHMHGHGNQISGFYFLDVPTDPPRAAIHDPRPAKIYANLPEANQVNATYASNIINFLPKPGMFMFMNSWLPHSLTKNPSADPFRFLHFNVSIVPAPPKQQTAVEQPLDLHQQSAIIV
jgi:hypothetical protein